MGEREYGRSVSGQTALRSLDYILSEKGILGQFRTEMGMT